MMRQYPTRLEILLLAHPPQARVRVPGSKSITNRAFLLAALASRETACELTGVLHSEDTETMADCLQRLGFRLIPRWDEARVGVKRHGHSRLIPAGRAELDCRDAGMVMRFLTAAVALEPGRYILDGSPRMRQRPMGDLLDGLRQLGVRAESVGGDGYPPVVVESNGRLGGTVRIRGDVSSQFASGLLLAAAFSAESVTIQLEGPVVSQPYLAMSAAMVRHWGGSVDAIENGYRISPSPKIGISRYAIEPDATSASYFLAAAAITGGEVVVDGLSSDSLQGDIRFAELLAAMGCEVGFVPGGLRVRGGPLRGIDADVGDMPDAALTLAVVAAFANGPTTLRNLTHLQYKESARLDTLAAELGRVGAGVEQRTDGLTIRPAPLHAAAIDPHGDHRIAMSMALVGLRIPGIVIQNPGCVAKSYPGFFHDLERLAE